jgi:very-short-patch-repair endonuclease
MRLHIRPPKAMCRRFGAVYAVLPLRMPPIARKPQAARIRFSMMFSRDLQAQMFAGGKRKKVNVGETTFASLCRQYQLPPFVEQYHFAKSIGRRWSFDFCFIDYKLAVEIEGVVFRRLPTGQMVASGRHASPDGFAEDCKKYATAVQLGFYVVRFTPKQVTGGDRYAIGMMQQILWAHGWRPK